jgi:hypothetical protein
MMRRVLREPFGYAHTKLNDVAIIGFVSEDTQLSENQWSNLNARMHHKNGAHRCSFASDLQEQHLTPEIRQRYRLSFVLDHLDPTEIKFVVCFDVQYGVPPCEVVHELLQHMRECPELDMAAATPSGTAAGSHVLSLGEAQSAGLVPELRELLVLRFPADKQLLAWQQSTKPPGVPLSAEPAFMLGPGAQVGLMQMSSSRARRQEPCCASFVRHEEQKEELQNLVRTHALCAPDPGVDYILECPHISNSRQRTVHTWSAAS